jgi:sugar phosphate isomerase/epimerase
MKGEPRVAGAPISWGVIEIPDWGYQMPADRLLREAASVGLEAMEAGPEDFLPQDPAEVGDLLSGHGLGLVRVSFRPCCTSRSFAGKASTSSSDGHGSYPRRARTR